MKPKPTPADDPRLLKFQRAFEEVRKEFPGNYELKFRLGEPAQFEGVRLVFRLDSVPIKAVYFMELSLILDRHLGFDPDEIVQIMFKNLWKCCPSNVYCEGL